MFSQNKDYPDHLNPFDSDEDNSNSNKVKQPDAYPEYLDPFEEESKHPDINHDYDDSLNPFGDEDEPTNKLDESNTNPFDEDGGEIDNDRIKNNVIPTRSKIQSPIEPIEESLGPPPVPLPRTKSLLKKEQAIKNKKQQGSETPDYNCVTPPVSPVIQEDKSNSSATDNSLTTTNQGSFQKRKNKRDAPPVPINFKRQVSGSLDAMEEELNGIGDKLSELEREFDACQKDLMQSYRVNDAEFVIARSKFVDIFRRKSSFLRRQKELMYRKRELKLDQIYSDIEYDLRMIGNKQLSHRTPEDDSREKDLLKKLVEIVEEKNDIVENLNKDSSNDVQDVEEALKRMNILEDHIPPVDKKGVKSGADGSKPKENCDGGNTIKAAAKLSKIATLLPKSGTLKGTIKMKRKNLFKKSIPRSIEQ